jgi:heat shock protein HtpX
MSFSVYLRAAALFALLTGFLLLVGFIVGYYFLGAPVFDVLFFMLFISVVMNLISYYFGPSMVLRLSGARLAQPGELTQVRSMLESLAQSENIPVPKLGVADQPQPNAFTTGRGKNDAIVVVTTGLLRTMNENELMAVLGHEVGHIVHRDTAMATAASTLATAVTYLADLVLFSLFFGGGSRRGGAGAGIFAVILAPFAATMIQLALSRGREYYADEEAAKLSRPEYLVSALEKIENYIRRGVPINAPQTTSSLWISNPFRGSFSDLFSTHPATEKRIKRLREISRKAGYYY